MKNHADAQAFQPQACAGAADLEPQMGNHLHKFPVAPLRKNRSGMEVKMISGDDIKKNISKNITKYRELAGYSQRELAQRLEITPSRISNWEQGANCPTIDILFEVCKTLNVSINDIYGVYPASEMLLSYDEQQHIKKYRSLDDHGRETVDILLERELLRLDSLKKNEN